jgi:hypothetical protein
MFGKNKAAIAKRREVKRKVVELMVQVLEAAPHGLMGNATLDDEELNKLFVLVISFVNSLNEDDINTLKTAKGCQARPANTQTEKALPWTLHEFIIRPKLGLDAGCMHGWASDCQHWAKQVALMNPHSHINWPACQTRLNEALKKVEMTKKQYFADPSVREPTDPEEAFLYLVQAALKISYENEKKEERERERLWKAKYDGLPGHLRSTTGTAANDNTIALYSRGYKNALKTGIMWYIEGKVPEQYL